MTLEDFFTSNELKNGFTTPDRVNKLITMMQSEKDLVANSFCQTTRQWSTVARVIAATETMDCLDLFIKLNGLFFIDKWLKDAQKPKSDDGNGFLEELAVSLLRALKKLLVHDERLFSSGIMKTVQDLVANGNHTVREKAKELCDKNKILQDAKNSETVESRPPDNSLDSETKNQDPLDCGDPSSKSMDDYDNGDTNSKSEDVGRSDAKNENEINFRDKTDSVEILTLSSPLEQIAASADVDNPLESCVKTDVLIDKDDGVADDGEIQKMSSNSDGDNRSGNTIIGVQSNGDSEKGPCLNNSKSDMEPDYGMIDPLDIARQVAIEVEREVGSLERSCSASEKTPGGIKRPNTLDSRNDQESQSYSQRQNQPVDGTDKEVSLEPVIDAKTLVSQISEVARESELDTGRPFSWIDLNQEACSEEVDDLDNLASSSISVVSISRAAHREPTAPLEFEGTLGCKGFASTSVLQADPEGSTTHYSNQWLDFHDFDLNVAEDGQELNMLITPGLPSGVESSVANPRKPERPQWDLNSIGDDQNGTTSSSSSSTSKQPILRNIDLNLDDQSDDEDPIVTIFGVRVMAETLHIFGTRVVEWRNDHKPQLEPKIDFSLGKPLDSSMHDGHHNGMFFSMPMYGSSSHGTPMHTPMPDMVDSRGTWLQPRIMESQPPSPYFMNMVAAGAPSGAIGLEPPQNNLDLNTGLMFNAGSRQFSPQNVNEQASSSSVLGKRCESDSNWQFFPVNKHHQPPWR